MEVNKSIPKVDGVGLVLGKPAYTDDIAQRDALIVKVLRSPHAHAEIMSIDTHIAEKFPEIKCILTYENVNDHLFSRAGQGFPEPSPYDRRILDKIVRYVGDSVVVVAGTTEKVVDMAMEKIKVEYKVLEPVLDFEKALTCDATVHDNNGTSSPFEIGHKPEINMAAKYGMEIGSVEDTLKDCEHVFRGRYYTHAQAHAMTEPHSCTAYYDFNNRLTIISSTQTPFHVRRILSKNLEMPLSQVRVIKPRVGGGYGGKQAIHGEFFAAMVAKITSRPCKVIYSRKEAFESTYTRHQMRIDMTIGAMKDGTLKALDMEILSNTGAYGEHALTVLMVAGSKTLPLYNKVEAVGFRGDVVYTNTTPAGAFRGYGAIQGNFAMESAMDELAKELNMDPVELRKKNMIAEGETSKIFEIMGEGQEGSPMNVDSCKLDECLEKCLDKLGWKDKYPREEIDEHKVRGVGMALAMQGSGIPYIDMASAIIKLNDDGFFNLLIGATDIGQGSDTILSQIAAETLMVPTEKVIPYSSDTDITPFDTGAYASSTTYVSGQSVIIAAKKMVEELKRVGREYLEVDEVEYDGEKLFSGDKFVTLKDISTKLYYSYNQEQLATVGSYYGTKSPPPFMVGGAEVEIDKRTGKVDVLNYVAVVDCGTTINRNLARIQVEGGILQGIGMALYEEADRTEKGNLRNNLFLKYKVPTRMDVKNIDVEFVESYEESGPYGAKSVGEIGIDTPPAAIANAIENALGKRIRSLPIRAVNVWEELNSK